MYNDPRLEALRQYYLSQQQALLPDIEEDVVETVIADLLALRTTREHFIRLVICSHGGHTNAGFWLAQFIEFELDLPVHAKVFGFCNSAATYPLLCCAKRSGNQMASFVLHHQTSQIQHEYGDDFGRTATGWVTENDKLHAQQVHFYATKLGLSEKKVAKLLRQGSRRTNYRIDANKALELGLLTDVQSLTPSPTHP